MKKGIIILTLFATSITLFSCNKDEVINDVVTYNIAKLRKGFEISGEVTQTRYPATGTNNGSYVFNEKAKEENKYSVTIGFDNSTSIPAYSKVSTQVYENETYVIEDYLYYEDENGLTFKKKLNYKNEIDRDYQINLSTSSFTYNGFYNFFSIIDKEDLVKDESYTFYDKYNLNLNKASLIANNLLYSLNTGFSTKVKEAYFRLTKNDFSEFHLVMNPYYYLDTNTSVFYKIDNEVTFKISHNGNYRVEDLKPLSNKNNNKLKKALSKINDNYKLTVEKNVTDKTLNTNSISYKDFYFDSKTIYVHNYTNEDGSKVDFTKDYYLSSDETNEKLYSYVYDSKEQKFIKDKTNEFPSLYQGMYYYDDYLPIVSEVSSDLFKYDKEKDLYLSSSEASECLKSCFYLKNQPYREAETFNFSSYEIKLDGESIAYIKLNFSYLNFEGSVKTGYYKVTYNDIGSTKNPAL